jgi:hypothetical protein
MEARKLQVVIEKARMVNRETIIGFPSIEPISSWWMGTNLIGMRSRGDPVTPHLVRTLQSVTRQQQKIEPNPKQGRRTHVWGKQAI